MAVKISRSFKDISLSFTRHPITNDLTVLKNEDSIKRSVMNLVRTRIGERFFNNLLGTSIENSLFEIQSSEISVFLEQEITNLINNYEYRIKLNNVIIESELDNNDLNISISYDIVGMPFATQNIEFILQSTKV
jgi:phage baseplate assembly protein W